MLIEIIPAIMPKTIEDIYEKVGLVTEALSFQLDIMDGKFVPEKTFPFFGEKIVSINIGVFELDLMVKNASDRIPEWVHMGASRLIFHIEADEDILDNFLEFQDVLKGIERGIAINLDTPLEKLDQMLPYFDFVQFMGIARIGYQGEQFDRRVIDRIKEFKKAYPYSIVSVDGGVNKESAQLLKEAGVDRLVIGSAIFNSGSPEENLQSFEKLLN